MAKAALHLPYDNKTFIINGNELDSSVFKPVKTKGTYEPHVMRLLKKIIRHESVCLDIGANIGLISLALSYLAKEGQVYSFEPSKTNFPFLVQTIEDNHIKNISPINVGVYDRNTNINFCEIGAGGGGWSFVFDETKIDATPNEIIPCIKLDDWVQNTNVQKVDFIKIDIEGSEIKAIQGASNTIKKWKPDLIVEFNPIAISDLGGAEPEELYNMIKTAGYPSIYVLKRDNTLVKAADYSTLMQLMSGGTHEDLYCSFK
ncbi:FkbM family methyltransferase [Metabacillus sp. 84]|uniref:FkbM family methyltransferase n=1 Tax=unclassified Metabacillus TaxID=2675274 RepID=UPI003CF4E759